MICGDRQEVFKGSVIVAISVQCECGKVIQTGDENAGRRTRCPVCQRELILPQPKLLPPEELADFREYAPPATSGKAIASLVLGLCIFVFCCITGIPAIVFGALGLSDINNPKKRVTGKGMAIAGIVLGSLSVLAVPLWIALLLPAVQAAREAARRAQCTNNVKIITLAMHNYVQEHGTFPPAAKTDADGKPLLSWRVLILPYLEQQTLYSQFHLDEPWDSPTNKPLADKMPDIFQCPSETQLTHSLTTYQVIVDPRSMFTGEPTGVPIAGVTDGTSNTLLVVEATTAVPWSKPEDLSLASPDPMLGMGSKHPGGLNASMADGSVRFIKTSISPQDLRALATRNGSEVVAPQ
jgi:prepilin-type processing-associated H-X9-DG protein